MDIEQPVEYEDPEISLLKEWLPKIKGEKLAYIKGASKALLYVQENQNTLLDTDKPYFGE